MCICCPASVSTRCTGARRGILKTLVELDLGDGLAVGIGEVVELGLELCGADLGDLREGGDGGWEEDEQAGADEREVDGAGECAGGGDDARALQELERQRRQDERRDCLGR